MSKEPEIGQLCWGQPTGNYGTDEFADALVEYILAEIERVYWNNNQEEWDRFDDPKMKGVEFRPYYYDDSDEGKKPNLKFEGSAQEIRWYKHPGRGQSCTRFWDEKQWRRWFDKALKIIRKNEKDIYDDIK